MFHKVIVPLKYIDLFVRPKNYSGEDSQPYCNNLPIMLALCLMLSGTYYAENYAGIIGLDLYARHRLYLKMQGYY